MSEAFATLIFLVASWAAVTAVLALLDDSGTKIKAALLGRSLASREPVARPVTVRFSPRYPTPRSEPVRVQAEWRAAA